MRSRLLLLVLLLCSQVFSAAEGLQQDSEGWTIFTPSSDTRIYYVSSSDGNDQTAASYSVGDVGGDPMNPSIAVSAYETFGAALNASRNDMPDWILVKRGDTLTEGTSFKNGRSVSERFVVSTYGDAIENPLFLPNSNQNGIGKCCGDFQYVAIQGLDFYARYRNPDDPAFETTDGANGFEIFVGGTHLGQHLLIEGSRFRFFANNTIQAGGELENIVMRRNTFLDNYGAGAHSQGIYAWNASIELEENIFDHNGWYQQAQDGADLIGEATIFNHNTYFADMHHVTMKGNVFLRSSSIQNKWTANQGVHSTTDVLVDDNLYVDGEIAMSIGGNTQGPHRFRDVVLQNNVMLKIGESQPTNRTLGWGIAVIDWDGGQVVNNYFLNQTKSEVNNTWGLEIKETVTDVEVSGNVFYNLNRANALVVDGAGDKTNVSIENNVFHHLENGGDLIRINTSLDGLSFAGNQYFHETNSSTAFRLPSGNIGFSDWTSQSGETGASWQESSFHDPSRDLESYLVSIGETGTFEHYIDLMRSVHMREWRPELMAAAVNQYIRSGFSDEEEGPVSIERSIEPVPLYNLEKLKRYDLKGRRVLD